MLYYYNGDMIEVYERHKVKPDKLKVLKEDAERILGIRPALRNSPIVGPTEEGAFEYLDPPPPGSWIREYAEGVLAIEPPAVKIWHKGRPRIVSASDLIPVPGYGECL